ncbi:sporulation initiation inhibitor Soj [Candidatus Saccharibacteria bacterium CG10_big_fil_rev_8_21_14_0_10_47_8]|nr:MAG: sporulation initiation inhibitor Soj [Candidatus Saccharibacteria bacterium CG10_big_fil_rev_8_21_14_0_10_47_8]
MTKYIIAVLNQKGGVGKTTTTINLAAFLAHANRRVLVVDLDPQGNTTSGLGVDKQTLDSTLYDVLFSRAQATDVIREVTSHGLFLLPANAQLAAAEVELVSVMNREQQLKQILQRLDYDIILIDCPPSLGLLSINALTAAAEVLIPVQTEYYALEGLSQLLSVIGQVRQALNPSLNILGMILTMYDSRTSLSEQVKQELDKHFGAKVFKTVIPRNVRLAEAPSFGKTIAEHDKWSKGARAYKALAKEVEKRLT